MQRAYEHEEETVISDLKVWRWTGAFGAPASILLVAAFPLYFVTGTPPRLEDAAVFTGYVANSNSIFLTRILVDTLYITGCLILLVSAMAFP